MATFAPLAALPLLTGLPDEVRALIEMMFVPVQLAFGQSVIEQGDPPDGYYVVVEGAARVVVAGDDGQEVSLNVLGPGDAFGEAALLEGTPRTATVRASSELTVLRLDRAAFLAVAERYPSVAEAFRADAHARRINDFLRVHSAFAALPREATMELIEQLRELPLADGQIAVGEGEAADALYLIQDGRLGVWIGERRVRTMHAGEFFGELALLRGTARTATVRAEGPASLLRLDAAEFNRLISEQPAFASRVAERVALYDARDRIGDTAAPQAPQDGIFDPLDPGLAVTEHGDAEGDANTGAEPTSGRRRRRFPFIRQIDEMDCGAACTGMVCRSFGHDISMTAIRYAVGTDTEGTTLRGLVRGGNEIGLDVRAIKSSADRLDKLPLPAIVHWDGRHWVIVYGVEGERVRLADPARGLRVVNREEVEENWSGYAALVRPTERLADAPAGGMNLGWLVPFLAPHKRKLIFALLFALLAAGLTMVLPVFSSIIIDRVVGHRDQGLLYLLFAGMLGVLVVAVGVTILQRLFVARVAAQLDADTLDFMSGRLLSLPMRYFEARRTGDIERRLSGLQQIRSVLIQNGVVAVTAATQLFVATVIMFVYAWQLGLLYVAFAPLYGALMRFSSQRIRPIFDSVEAGHGRYQSRQIDAIRGIATVKTMGAEQGLRERMRTEFGELREKLFRADLVAMVYEGLTSVVTFFVYAVFLFFAALEVLHHNLSVGGLVAFNALVLLANAPMLELLSMWDRLQFVAVLMGRLQDVIEQEPEQGFDRSRLQHPAVIEGHIRLRRVSFSYATASERPILHDISLDVAPGSMVALVGRSGSGKSTLVKCLAGLLLPTGGTIEFDGIDMTDLSFTKLRQRIGFVLQEPYLFDDTIETNIAFGEPDPDPEQVRRAAELANAAEFIEALPLGYQTRIGESGLRLSGGQAQRVAIARALYREPPVLIFDEATSALDTEAERMVKSNMDRLLEGRTAFVIAHRLSTIRDADVICVLEQGRLVEQGSHEELLRRQGLYAYLQAQQLEG
jgi:ABC-type bacteriocin/lantibiotic exporter with double-glycine peptidase domain/CRP-like cAMP-binding protein